MNFLNCLFFILWKLINILLFCTCGPIIQEAHMVCILWVFVKEPAVAYLVPSGVWLQVSLSVKMHHSVLDKQEPLCRGRCVECGCHLLLLCCLGGLGGKLTSCCCLQLYTCCL